MHVLRPGLGDHRPSAGCLRLQLRNLVQSLASIRLADASPSSGGFLCAVVAAHRQDCPEGKARGI
jgi:hypothetical protein